MLKDKNQPVTFKELEKMLVQQTAIILDAVDKRIGALDSTVNKRIDLLDKRIDTLDITLNKRMDKMEFRINQKIEHLANILDRFLKRITDLEEEFQMMKADINRMKKVIKEKLGVELN